MCPHYEETGKRRVNLDMVPCRELDSSILKLSVTLNYLWYYETRNMPIYLREHLDDEWTNYTNTEKAMKCKLFLLFLRKEFHLGMPKFFSIFGLKYSALDTDSILNVKWCNSWWWLVELVVAGLIEMSFPGGCSMIYDGPLASGL